MESLQSAERVQLKWTVGSIHSIMRLFLPIITILLLYFALTRAEPEPGGRGRSRSRNYNNGLSERQRAPKGQEKALVKADNKDGGTESGSSKRQGKC